jgi:hypothetical protein
MANRPTDVPHLVESDGETRSDVEHTRCHERRGFFLWCAYEISDVQRPERRGTGAARLKQREGAYHVRHCSTCSPSFGHTWKKILPPRKRTTYSVLWHLLPDEAASPRMAVLSLFSWFLRFLFFRKTTWNTWNTITEEHLRLDATASTDCDRRPSRVRPS